MPFKLPALIGLPLLTLAQRTKILPLGDSITYGCGSSQALPPSWTVSCGPTAGGYRAPLYHALRDTGFVDADGNASFVMVGTQFNGPVDIPLEQTANEGHPGWTIPQASHSNAEALDLATLCAVVIPRDCL
jgi:hypothetical protein